MENAPSFKVPNFNIPDTKSGKHLPDSKAASNLTHGNVASTVVSHFVHLQNKQIMTDNATSRNDQNINISDVKSIKHLPDAKAATKDCFPYKKCKSFQELRRVARIATLKYIQDCTEIKETKAENTCTGKPITEMLVRECRKEIRKREKALYERRSQARNRLFSLAYFTLILVLASTIVSLYVYLQCRQMSMEKAISCNVLNFNISGGRCAKHLPDAHAASNLTKGPVVQKGHILTYTYRIENDDDIVKYIFVISVMVLVFSVAVIPIVIYNHTEDNTVYNGLNLRVGNMILAYNGKRYKPVLNLKPTFSY
ncbi:hypothetical protein CDAR_586761 [Caerostris darwini]|uniref:Uncharacterized protein n=1 Tax=Caerostris darwini TaxID=1538125 RepID=A0AAV4TJS9_9ARAC|nr:hypothetical protein CDAR_586761 [Caerostris darwini]